MLIDAKENYASSTSDKVERFRKQTSGRVHGDVHANPSAGLYFGDAVFCFWIQYSVSTEPFSHLPPKFSRLNDEDLSRPGALEQHEKQQPNRTRAEDSDTFTGYDSGLFKSMEHACERFRQARAFSRNILADFV